MRAAPAARSTMRRALLAIVLVGCGAPAKPVVGPGPAVEVPIDPITARLAHGPDADTEPVDEPAVLDLDDIDPALLGESARQAGLEPAIGRAQAALDARQWDKAIAQARGALALDPDEPRAVAALVRALIGKAWWDSARVALAGLDDAKRRIAGSGELWYLAGWTSAHLGDSDRALVELGKAVKLRKDDAAAWNLMGVVHLERAEVTQAVTALENARTHDPDSIAIMTNLGSAYRRHAITVDGADRDELLRKAEQSYQSAIRGGVSRPKGGYAPAYLGLGLLYLDARPFPGMDDVARLQAALDNLQQAEDTADGDVDPVLIDRDRSQAKRDLDRARRAADKARGNKP